MWWLISVGFCVWENLSLRLLKMSLGKGKKPLSLSLGLQDLWHWPCNEIFPEIPAWGPLIALFSRVASVASLREDFSYSLYLYESLYDLCFPSFTPISILSENQHRSKHIRRRKSRDEDQFRKHWTISSLAPCLFAPSPSILPDCSFFHMFPIWPGACSLFSSVNQMLGHSPCSHRGMSSLTTEWFII